jgi:putative ABC transport system permease protein
MSLLAALRHRLRTLLRPGRYARDLREEIDFHLSLDAADQTPNATHESNEAAYAARRRFGNVTRYSEETREMSGLGFFDTLRQDARFAFRTFRQSKGFTAVAVSTIALGIGATAAIFSVVDSLILKPLPYPDADRIVMVWMDNRKLGLHEDVHSYPNLMDLRAQNRSLSHLNAYYETGYNLTGSGEPVRVNAGVMSAEALGALSARPIVGQLFTAENEKKGSDGVAVIGEGLWKTNFGGDPSVLGKTIELNGRSRTIVGVLPASFGFPSERTQLWVPLVVPENAKTARSWFSWWAVGKIKPGVSLEQARADLGAIAKRLSDQYPTNRDYGVWVTPLPEEVVGPTLRTTLWVILGAVAAVLLIACANVANLLFSRAAVREREVTVRMALGASNGRLVRQLLTESLLLSTLGGVVGIALAFGALRVLPRLAPSDLPRLSTIHLNGTVLLVTAAVTVFTGLLFGLVPAMQSSRTRLSENLREGGRGGTAGRSGQRLRRAIVAAQLALVVVLLTGAGLLLRTWVTLQQVQLGFSPKNELTLTVQLPGAKYAKPADIVSFYERLLDRVRALPGVENAGTIETMLLSATPNSGGITVEGRAGRPGDKEVTFDGISPGFFSTIGARLAGGRNFTASDRQGTTRVAIVNETAVKNYFPGGAVGKRFRFGTGATSDTTENPWITVVGVVADMRRTGVDKAVRDEAFFPFAQSASPGQRLVIRTTGEPLSFAGQVRRVVREIDPTQPISNVGTMEQLLSGRVAQRRFSMTLVGMFAALALTLALIGAYGVTSYLVSQRTREIGIRMALGADSRRVARSVVGEGLRVAATGVFAGLIIALFTTRLASGLLYGVSPRDPLTLGAVVLTLLAVSAIANYLPARRAARVDPLTALRQD